MKHSANDVVVGLLKEILINIKKPKTYKAALNVSELAEYSGLGEDKIRQLVHTDDFPSFRNGSKWLINRQLFDEWHNKVAMEHRQL